MARPTASFLLAETADEFIELESARRWNQARRKRWSAEFRVVAHKSHLEEKVAQARRHKFLLRSDNKASILDIIDIVRDLANEGVHKDIKSEGLQCSWNSVERDRMKAWASDVEKLLCEFKPSVNHLNDPLLQIVEFLQFLLDGDVCLAEAKMYAGALLERWDRAGVFSVDSISDGDNKDNNVTNEYHDPKCEISNPNRAKDSLLNLARPDAYQSVRQRVAARIIKRHVITWKRSKDFLSKRVTEIEIAENRTEQLFQSPRLKNAAFVNSNIKGIKHDLALTQRNPKPRCSDYIIFNDLRQYSKYMALFPIDQALRSVEDVSRRRYLFLTRCAIKIQTLWRQVREAVQTRRLHRAFEDLLLQQNKEDQARRKAMKEAKRKKSIDAGKPKIRKVFRRSSTAKSSMILQTSSKLTYTSKDKILNERTTTQSTRAPSSILNAMPKLISPSDPPNTRGSTISAPSSTSQNNQQYSAIGGTSNNDSGDINADVENVWKPVIENDAADLILPTALNDTNILPPLDNIPASAFTVSNIMSTKNTWESWSDDEVEAISTEDLPAIEKIEPETILNIEAKDNIAKIETEANTEKSKTEAISENVDTEIINENVETDNQLACISILSQPTSPVLPSISQMKVVVTIKTSNEPEAAGRQSLDTEFTTSKSNQNRPQTKMSNTPPSSLSSESTVKNHIGPFFGAAMAPFVDTEISKKSQVSISTRPKHLYELDFNKNDRMDASFVHVTDARGLLHEFKEQLEQYDRSPAEVIPIVTAEVKSRQTTFARLRSNIDSKEQGINNHERGHLYDHRLKSSQSSHSNSKPIQLEYKGTILSILVQRFNPDNPECLRIDSSFQRETIIREGLMESSSMPVQPEKKLKNAIGLSDLESKGRPSSQFTALLQSSELPYPPVDRYRPHYRRQIKANESNISSTKLKLIDLVTNKAVDDSERYYENTLLRRRSSTTTYQQEIEETNTLPKNHKDIGIIKTSEPNGQLWKRSRKLPDIALAQIRDRAIHHQGKSNLTGRTSIRLVRRTIAPRSSEAQPETILLVGGDVKDHNGVESYRNTGRTEECESSEVVKGNIENYEGVDSKQYMDKGAIIEKFERLNLLSRERELSHHRTQLTQLQSDKNVALEQNQRRTIAAGQELKHKQQHIRREREKSNVKSMSEASKFKFSELVSSSGWQIDKTDKGMKNSTPRRLRVKTREVKAISSQMLFDEDSEKVENSAKEEAKIECNTKQQERDAAFVELLTQYLGLLQCAPEELVGKLN